MANEEQLKLIIRHTVLKAHKAFSKKAHVDRSMTNLEKATIIADAVFNALAAARLLVLDPPKKRTDRMSKTKSAFKFVFGFAIGAGWSLLALAAVAQSAVGVVGLSQFVRDEASVKEIVFENMRGTSYCELWFYNADGRVAYFNTSELNNSADPKATCPSNSWDHISTRALAKQLDVKSVFKVGPRVWMFDAAVLTVSTVIETYDGLQARWWGNLRIPKGVDVRRTLFLRYYPTSAYGKTTFTFRKGLSVFLLDSTDGSTWVLEALAGNPFTASSLSELGGKLELPIGWRHRTKVLDQDLTLTSSNGVSRVMADNLYDIYEACDDNICNYRP